VTVQLFLTVFATVFLAELGDKTQLATLLFAGRSPGNLASVFLGASAALVVSTAIGVAAGAGLAHLINPKALTYVAGIGFIAVGIWTLWSAQAG
jgi:putative Ca2+/H+ antiporter (TMEM165/GDT1 family)